MMRNLYVVMLLLCMAATSCKKEGTVTVYVKKQLPGQALQYGAFAIVSVYTADSVTQVSAAEASQFGIAAIDLKEGDYLIRAETWGDTSALTGSVVTSIRKGEHIDVNVTIQ